MNFLISIDELNEFAEQFWCIVKDAKVFAFYGEMGAGKTTIISALCNYKGTKDTTGSPTFSIINEYKASSGETIYHIDLYRIKDETEAINAGIEDALYSGNTCWVEWPEKAPGIFPDNSTHALITVMDTNTRKLQINL